MVFIFKFKIYFYKKLIIWQTIIIARFKHPLQTFLTNPLLSSQIKCSKSPSTPWCNGSKTNSPQSTRTNSNPSASGSWSFSTSPTRSSSSTPPSSKRSRSTVKSRTTRSWISPWTTRFYCWASWLRHSPSVLTIVFVRGLLRRLMPIWIFCVRIITRCSILGWSVRFSLLSLQMKRQSSSAKKLCKGSINSMPLRIK